MAQILVSDSFQVHIVDNNGQFLRFLDIVCSNPMRLALDEGDNLFIADTHGNVKMVVYMRRNILEDILRVMQTFMAKHKFMF